MRNLSILAKSSSTATGGIGFVGALQLVFIVLKLLGKISWSWWWVLSPTWISALMCVTIIFIVRAVIKWIAR